MRQPHWTDFEPDLRSPRHLLSSVMTRRRGVIAVLFAVSLIGYVANGLIPILIGYTVAVAVAGVGITTAIVALAATIIAGSAASVTRIVLNQQIRMWTDTVLTTRVGTLAASGAEDFARNVPAGKVATVISSDTGAVGGFPGVLSRAIGSFVAFVVVAVYLLSKSLLLGSIVLVGVPIVFVLLPKIVGPLEERQSEHRDRVEEIAGLGADIAEGLRVLRGVGGETEFTRRYRSLSARVEAAGLRVSNIFAMLHGAQVLLPGAFLVGVTWVGARLAMAGQIGVGELVAFYACASYLVLPIQAMADFHAARTRARIGAERIISVLSTKVVSIDNPQAAPASPELLTDASTGVVVQPGKLTAIVIDKDAELLAQRLVGLSADSSAQWGNVSVSQINRADRFPRMTFVDGKPHLFSGQLRDDLDPDAIHSDDHLWTALSATVADEIVRGVDGELNAEIHEAGLNLSGGQRQRLALARAIITGPEVLVLVDPTNALDATTEAKVVSGIADFRYGKTTTVINASPPWLDRADRVVWVHADGTVEGNHRELTATNDDYCRRTMRGMSAPC